MILIVFFIKNVIDNYYKVSDLVQDKLDHYVVSKSSDILTEGKMVK